MQRQIILDTETTGLDPKIGHRVIEIGCVEMIDRQATGNNFHQYLQPDREIDAEAEAVHGISNQFLRDKPRFMDIAEDFIAYIRGAELIIHNAAFDISFLNHEIAQTIPELGQIEQLCTITDTLSLARKMYPGQRNTLDALCKRLSVDNSNRELHGALLDARILADVYLAMTGGQVSLVLDSVKNYDTSDSYGGRIAPELAARLPVIQAQETELTAHIECLNAIKKTSGKCAWEAT